MSAARRRVGSCTLSGMPAFDAVYSAWGVVWFTDPEILLPLVAKSLTSDGVFAFGRAEPSPGAYGPQPMRGKWLEGRESELTVLRRQYTPQAWADLLKRHGFTNVDARVVPAPGGEKSGHAPRTRPGPGLTSRTAISIKPKQARTGVAAGVPGPGRGALTGTGTGQRCRSGQVRSLG